MSSAYTPATRTHPVTVTAQRGSIEAYPLAPRLSTSTTATTQLCGQVFAGRLRYNECGLRAARPPHVTRAVTVSHAPEPYCCCPSRTDHSAPHGAATPQCITTGAQDDSSTHVQDRRHTVYRTTTAERSVCQSPAGNEATRAELTSLEAMVHTIGHITPPVHP